jgi:magnesium transporter
MEVRWIGPAGVETHGEGDLASLLAREGGFMWVDIPVCDARAQATLLETFHFHPLSVRDCHERVPLPKIHAYPDHFFVVLHAVEPADGGRLHLIELDQFVSLRYLVTVHGPIADGVPEDLAGRETRNVMARLDGGRFRPKFPGELAHAIVTSLARRLETVVGSIAGEIAALEQRVMKGNTRNHEPVLEELFRVRHQLLTVRTIATQSREVHARMAGLTRASVPETAFWVEDLLDYFDRLRNICDGQKDLLQEVLDFYQTRIANELSRFVKRLTSIGAILVSDTLIAGIYGMNFRHMPELEWPLGYPMALLLMVVVSLALVVYFRRKDWL